MVEPFIGMDGIQGSERSGLGIRRSPDASVDARLMHEPCAHDARLDRHIHDAARKSPATKGLRGGAHGGKLRMPRRIAIGFSAIMSTCDNAAIAYHHGTDGHFPLFEGATRFGVGLAHERLVLIDALVCRGRNRVMKLVRIHAAIIRARKRLKTHDGPKTARLRPIAIRGEETSPARHPSHGGPRGGGAVARFVPGIVRSRRYARFAAFVPATRP